MVVLLSSFFRSLILYISITAACRDAYSKIPRTALVSRDSCFIPYHLLDYKLLIPRSARARELRLPLPDP